MKAIQLLLLAILMVLSTSMVAQISIADDWNRDRLLREQKAMKVLFVWGSVNLGSGVAGSLTFENTSDARWFSAMNAGFGLVNTSLGLLGMSRTNRQLKHLPTLEQGYKDLRKTRNVLLVNAGLDVGYIVTGVLIRDNVISDQFVNNPDRFGPFRKRGFGTSLIVQGAALLIFDSVTAWSLSKSEIHISPVLTPNGAGLGFQSNLSKPKPQGVAWF